MRMRGEKDGVESIQCSENVSPFAKVGTSLEMQSSPSRQAFRNVATKTATRLAQPRAKVPPVSKDLCLISPSQFSSRQSEGPRGIDRPLSCFGSVLGKFIAKKWRRQSLPLDKTMLPKMHATMHRPSPTREGSSRGRCEKRGRSVQQHDRRYDQRNMRDGGSQGSHQKMPIECRKNPHIRDECPWNACRDAREKTVLPTWSVPSMHHEKANGLYAHVL